LFAGRRTSAPSCLNGSSGATKENSRSAGERQICFPVPACPPRAAAAGRWSTHDPLLVAQSIRKTLHIQQSRSHLRIAKRKCQHASVRCVSSPARRVSKRICHHGCTTPTGPVRRSGVNLRAALRNRAASTLFGATI